MPARPGVVASRRPALGVVLLNRQKRRRVDEARLRQVLQGAARALSVSGEVALVLTGDGAVRTLNARYRGQDRPTDVLSFPGAGGEAGLGDIVISVQAAERNARALRRALPSELEILALHGFLHVLGYDHETDDGTMDRLERRLRRRLLNVVAAGRGSRARAPRRRLRAGGAADGARGRA